MNNPLADAAMQLFWFSFRPTEGDCLCRVYLLTDSMKKPKLQVALILLIAKDRLGFEA